MAEIWEKKKKKYQDIDFDLIRLFKSNLKLVFVQLLFLPTELEDSTCGKVLVISKCIFTQSDIPSAHARTHTRTPLRKHGRSLRILT